jgi:hypothetical protein
MRCQLAVSDCGTAEWQYWPQPGGTPDDPKVIADMVTALLTGAAGEQPRLGDGYGGQLTLKGVAGRERKARGLDVELEIYADEDAYDTSAAIVVTGPASDDGAWASVTDDGGIEWERDFWPFGVDLAAGITGPVQFMPAAEAAEAADTIAQTVIRALSCAPLSPSSEDERKITHDRSLAR